MTTTTRRTAAAKAAPTKAVKAKDLTPADQAALSKASVRMAVGGIGGKIDALFAKREAIRKLEAEIKVMEDAFKAAETVVLEEIERQGIDSARGKAATVSITLSDVHTLDDRAVFDAFIKKKGWLHVYQARLSEPALREIEAEHMKGAPIPGLGKFTKKRLNLRKVDPK